MEAMEAFSMQFLTPLINAFLLHSPPPYFVFMPPAAAAAAAASP